ncbi:His-Xaa-Ser system protein HxsD [Natronogracilivirga saccharolytica]|uniref:His-Xaa-Ser system protein HxsD n=1 Tax=Natronogracilivirga saccharolytica TaxID=2812953 RepID=A0A8J7UXM1_9BACT|nr:His-Xaa-Ser system protein HxsD [Natronogracilivirga saccharolytica]MBP3193479.1 His-Xaa-Ser system protein HxsD [Natronogracilivirga saccharolytica]
MEDTNQRIDADSIVINVDKNVFEITSIIHSSYIFTDRCYISINTNESGIEVCLKKKDKNINLDTIAREFNNEVIDQQIRLTTGREYKEIRKQLVKKAFSSINK